MASSIQQLPKEQNESTLHYVDMLADGKYIESLRDVKMYWAGSTNQRVIDLPRTFEQDKIVTIQN